MDIKEQQRKIQDLKLKIDDLTIQINVLESKLLDVKYKVHNILVSKGLYDYIIFDGAPVSNEFNHFSLDSLPYEYLGEGDFKEIIFQFSDNKLKLFYYNTLKRSQYLIAFPLSILDNEEAIVNFVLEKGSTIIENIKRENEIIIAKHIATLEARLNQLKNE